MNILLNGALGKMGAALTQLIEESDDMTLAAGVDPRAEAGDARGVIRSLDEFRGEADVLIDFSHHKGTGALLRFALAHHMPTVIATTGQTDSEKSAIVAASREIPVFFSANMSMGVAILADFARRAAVLLPDADVEIVEAHHNRKQDAPSGTALLLANAVKEARGGGKIVLGREGQGARRPGEIGVSALRLGSVVGEHEVILATDEESITLKHTAYSRALFARGALTAAAFLIHKSAGLYDMRSIVGK